MSRAGKFNRGSNRGTARCTLCKALKQRANIEAGCGNLCNDGPLSCYELTGADNEHSDNDGQHYLYRGVRGAYEHCPTCHPELQPLMTPAGRAAGGARS